MVGMDSIERSAGSLPPYQYYDHGWMVWSTYSWFGHLQGPDEEACAAAEQRPTGVKELGTLKPLCRLSQGAKVHVVYGRLLWGVDATTAQTAEPLGVHENLQSAGVKRLHQSIN